MIECWVESDESSEESSDEAFDNLRRFWDSSILLPADRDRLEDLFFDRSDLKLLLFF